MNTYTPATDAQVRVVNNSRGLITINGTGLVQYPFANLQVSE